MQETEVSKFELREDKKKVGEYSLFHISYVVWLSVSYFGISLLHLQRHDLTPNSSNKAAWSVALVFKLWPLHTGRRFACDRLCSQGSNNM